MSYAAHELRRIFDTEKLSQYTEVSSDTLKSLLILSQLVDRIRDRLFAATGRSIQNRGVAPGRIGQRGEDYRKALLGQITELRIGCEQSLTILPTTQLLQTLLHIQEDFRLAFQALIALDIAPLTTGETIHLTEQDMEDKLPFVIDNLRLRPNSFDTESIVLMIKWVILHNSELNQSQFAKRSAMNQSALSRILNTGSRPKRTFSRIVQTLLFYLERRRETASH